MTLQGLRWIGFVTAFLVLTGCAVDNGPQYLQRIEEVTPVPGLVVRVEHVQTVFWGVGVRNDTEEVVRLVWDESAYVTSTGTSSRLIRGSTRRIDSGQTQPASPVPPHAAVSEVFTAEQWIDYVSFDVTPQPADPTAKARIYLVFDMGGRKVGWEGEISFVAVQ